MKNRRRIAAALAVAGLCAPGLWLRSEVPHEFPGRIDLAELAAPASKAPPGWQVEGIWRYSTEPASPRFGGLSALLKLTDGRLRAFSDRGYLFTFVAPDRPQETPDTRLLAGLPFAEPGLYPLLWDIESATRDPVSGTYWVGFEGTHAIHRFSYRTEPEEVRMLDEEVGWYANGGLEAMVRLSDGRFLLLPERGGEALLYPEDPVEGSAPQAIAFASPDADFLPTDMAQLPDGRLLILMRATAWDNPPFAALIAIADPPGAASPDPEAQGPWRPQIALRLDGVIPAENYEGMALEPLEDGRIAVWLVSDDNFSILQRTLLVKLVFDPEAAR